MNGNEPASPAKGQGIFYGWTIVGICFLSLNISVGIVFAGYNPLIVAIQEQFGTSRALASSGPPIASISLGIVALFIGGLIQKYNARTIMIGGAALVATGFLIASLVDNIYVLLGVFGTLIGMGFVAMGIVTCSTLVTRWFNTKRGLALGIINLFPGMVIFPLLSTYLLINYGLKSVFLINAAIFALLIPILFLVVNRPEDRGLTPLGGTPQPTAMPDDDTPSTPPAKSSAGELLANPAFWMLSLGIAILTGAANMISMQAMPMLLDTGVSAMEAASTLSIYGLAIALAAPFFGMLVDKIGPLRGLMVEIAIVIVPWVLIAMLKPGFGTFTALLFIIGIANGGIVTLHTSTASILFKPEQFSRAMGMGYFIKMPFLLTTAPAAGHIFDKTGSYDLAIIGGVVSIVIAGALFAALQFTKREKIHKEPVPTKA